MPTVEWLNEGMPSVVLLPEVKKDMDIIINNCDDEIGWLGLVRKEEDNVFLVYNILPLPQQDVNGGTTEITPDGLAELMGELITSGDMTTDEANNIRLYCFRYIL